MHVMSLCHSFGLYSDSPPSIMAWLRLEHLHLHLAKGSATHTLNYVAKAKQCSLHKGRKRYVAFVFSSHGGLQVRVETPLLLGQARNASHTLKLHSKEICTS